MTNPGKPRILYVEPNPMDVELTVQHFSNFAPQMQLHTVTSCKEALLLLRPGHGFNLVLTDLRVPGMDAIEFMREAQQRGIEVPFIVITGKGDEEVAVTTLQLGAYDYIVKRDSYLTQLPHSIDHALHRFNLHLTAQRLNAELSSLNATLEQKVIARTAEAEEARRAIAEVLERVSDAYVALDNDWCYTHINTQGAALFGRTPEQLIGKHIWTEFPEGLGQPFHLAYQQALAEQKPILLEDYYAPWDKWFENRIYPSAGGLSIFFHDITARKRAELALRKSEVIYRNLIENMHDLVQSVDAAGNLTFVNTAWCALLGWTHEEALQLNFSQLIKPDQLAHCHCLFEDLKRGKYFSQVEVTFIAKDGHEVLLECNLNGIFVDGMFTGTQSFFRDISERKRAELERKRAEEELNRIFELSLDMICTSNADGFFQRLNPAFERVLGYSLEELRQQPFVNFIHPDDRAAAIEEIEKISNGTSTVAFTNRYIAKDGTCRWLEWNSVTLPIEGTTYAVARDITQRMLAEVALRESEDRLKVTLESAQIGIWDWDIQHDIFYTSVTYSTMLGYDAESGPSDRAVWLDRIHPEDRQNIAAKIMDVLQGSDAAHQYEARIQHADGSYRWVSVQGKVVERDTHGAALRMLGVRTDITERKKSEAHLKLAAEVFEQSGEAFIITDANRNIIMVNPAFTAITGYSEAEALGKSPRLFYSEKQDENFYRVMWEAIQTQGHWQGEMWDRRKDGSVYAKWMTISRVMDAQGKLTNYVGIFSDISQHKQDEEHIQKLAHFDALTELPNRILLNDRIVTALNIAHRNSTSLAVMFVDLDHFKNVNDTLGHRIGDALLIEVAKRLKSVMREEDTVARLGGDEFIFVMPCTDAAGAAHVAEKLLTTVAQRYQIEQHELVITPSIGIAIYPNDGEDFESLSQCADIAMYRAKRDGRNNYRFFTLEMQASSARTLKLENALHDALERNQLMLHYQPQVSLEDGRITGVEALLRWNHPEFGWVPPAEFIPIAEDSGQILKLGEWVLRTAVRQMKTWIAKGMSPMTMAVNLSVVQFRSPNFPQMITQILDDEQLPAHHLELELTEGVAMDDPPAAIALMDNLHQRGIRMSIDDFGTGYSSLSYLKRFQVYKLKIDQSFVRDITIDPEDRAIVGAIIRLAEALGLQTIAEGVETEGQLEFLRDQGCNEMQGYYFSMPLPAYQFEAFVRSKVATVV